MDTGNINYLEKSENKRESKQVWYALYTMPRSEKKIEERLTQAGFQSYLPLHRVLKIWSDRKKWVEEPLFKSYIFVRIFPYEKFNVLSIYGAVKFVSFGGTPVEVPERDIDLIKRLTLAGPGDIEASQQNFEKGDLIEIVAGPMLGMQGELINFNGSTKCLVRIESIHQSIIVTLPKNFLHKVLNERNTNYIL